MKNYIVKIWSIFSKWDRLRIVLLLLLILVGSFLEVVGISAVVPLINVISNPEAIQKQASLQFLYDLAGVSSVREFMVFMCLLIVVIYLIKNAILLGIQFVQTRFIFSMHMNLSVATFRSYMKKDYAFHLLRNSSELLRNITHEVAAFVLYLLAPTLQMTTDIIIIVVIFAFLMFMSPYTTIFISFTLGIAVSAFNYLTSKKVEFYGKQRQYHIAKLNQQILQALGGVKEIKVLGNEEYFIEKYSQHMSANCRAGRFHTLLTDVPRHFIEMIAISAIMVVMIVFLYTNLPSESILTTFAMFGVAAVRLLPTVNRLTTSINTINYGKPSLEVVYNELKDVKTRKDSKECIVEEMKFKSSIILERVSYKYAGAHKNALSDLSLSIPYGTSVGFVGPTGAGKTTLIDLILGLLTPTEGGILVDDRNIRENTIGWQQQIGYIPQNIYLADETIRQNIAFGIEPEAIDEGSVMCALKLAQLAEFVETLPNGLKTVVGERGIRLSGGQRQRIGIARALYHDPHLLVMDEATASLDNDTEAAVLDAVNRLSGEKTMIIIAHRLTTVQNCDTIYFMKDGRIDDFGTYEELLKNNIQFRRMAKVGA